ncbi:MAG: FAD-binding oxidoreductase [Pseudomonadota bacterium]
MATGPAGSLWEATSPPPPPTAPLEERIVVDVAVIGAGITGLSTAVHLAERGVDVAILEAADAGFGGSGRNSGHVIPTLAAGDPDDLVARFGVERGERLVAFLRDSADVVWDLVARHTIDCEAVQRGWAMPAHRPSRMKLAESKHRQWARRQAPVELWDRAETAANMGTDTYYGAVFLPRGGHVNPLALCRGLARAAIDTGGRLHTGSPVLRFERTDEGRWRLTTPKGEVDAEKVVVATNAYTDALVPGLAKTLVKIVNYQSATYPMAEDERASVMPSDIAASDSRRDLRPFRKDRFGRLVTGATLALPVLMDRRIRPLIEAKIRDVFPQIHDPRLEHVWSGQIALTQDRMPRVHELAPGMVTAIAYNGRGMALGAAIGKELAAWAAGELAVDTLPLPKAPVRPTPLRSLVGRWAQLVLIPYRSMDRRD